MLGVLRILPSRQWSVSDSSSAWNQANRGHWDNFSKYSSITPSYVGNPTYYCPSQQYTVVITSGIQEESI